jgi:hypothetical protein
MLLTKITTEALRATRAMEVLEHLGTAQVRQVLHELEQGILVLLPLSDLCP